MTGTWQEYVTSLCNQAWNLHSNATNEVVTKIEALVTARVLTEPAVALILHRAGVSWTAADAMAPGIRLAISPSNQGSRPESPISRRDDSPRLWRIGAPERLQPVP